MSTPRRQFVHVAFAASLLYGLGRLALAGDDSVAPKPDPAPAWFKDALAEMKAAKCPLIAIVLPTDKEARKARREALQDLLRDPPLAVQMHLVEAVYVVVDGRQVGAKPRENVVLLDAEGRRVAGAETTFDVRFAAGLRPWLRDAEEFARRVKASKTPEVETLLKDLAGGEAQKSDAATQRLAERFPAAAPVVADAWENAKEGDVKTRLATTIIAAFRMRRGDEGTKFERPMPFGARWMPNPTPEPERDPCLGCGMMRMPAHRRDVLELLADADAKAK